MAQRHTVPPTAGLPLGLADLAPGGTNNLGTAMARFLGVEAALITCSGTAALCAALTALRQRAPERDTVVVPAYTCPLVALAVARCGLRLQLCDLRPESFDFDPDALARACTHHTLAVVPTHIGGQLADVDAALRCARAVGAWTIEDAAQALGARRNGASVGTQCDIGFFSLAVGKGLTLFEGGVLIARDPALYAACAAAHATLTPGGTGAWAWEMRRCAELLGYALCYRPRLLDWVYRRPLRQALRRGDWEAAAGDDLGPAIPLHRVSRWRQAVGVRALARLPAFLEAGRQRAAQRLPRLRAIPGLEVLACNTSTSTATGTDPTWPVLLVLLPSQARRDAVLSALWGAGCGVGLPFVQVLPDYPRYTHCVPADAALPHARALAGRLLAISNSPWLDDARFDALCQAITRLLRQPQ